MTVSQEMMGGMFDQETDEGLLILLTLSHEDLVTTIRVVNNKTNVTSRGDEFIAFAFEIVLPVSDADRPANARLTIDAVSLEIVQAIRSVQRPVDVLIEAVRMKNPDQVELSFPRLQLRNVRVTAGEVAGDLVAEDLQLEPFPADSFTPGYFPGLF